MKHIFLLTVLLLAACADATLDVEHASTQQELAFPGQSGPLGTTTIDYLGNQMELTYEAINGKMVVEGDIILGDVPTPDADGIVRQDLAVVGQAQLWPHGYVPFEFAGGVSQAQRNQTFDAMQHWHDNTDLRFFPWQTSDGNARIRITANGGCSAGVGYTGGVQSVNIGGCDGTGSIIHELGHSIGLWHTHSRPDRDDFIEINFRTIPNASRHNFAIRGTALGQYDTNSIMHYGSFLFGFQPTITRVDGSLIGGNRTGLSGTDQTNVRALYRDVAVGGPYQWGGLRPSPIGEFTLHRQGDRFFAGGWTLDLDRPTDALNVGFFEGVRYRGGGVANIFRSDVARDFPEAGGNHGMWIEVNVRAGRRVCAIAKNVAGGRDTNLGCRTAR